ncbi:helix-turn-helix domain-containing protein [Cytobacillus solani]|uniref:helix-turn-helix domain-containing protein n=1 Tax=Cytobacillus solani TaxID=1637975 RepID=UPI001152A54C|nr:helix-turn-helix domain-containing protein [Cytobacillus solani]
MNQNNLIKNELPEVLTPKHIQEILGIGRRTTYEMMENPPFHVAKVGKLYKVSKKTFFNWLDGDQ